MRITRFRVEGLFSEVDVEIPIHDNRMIIVGYNGLGKSTLLNIFYYVISRQWGKLERLDFERFEIDFEGAEGSFVISKGDIETYTQLKNARRRIGRHGSLPKVLVSDVFAFLEGNVSSDELKLLRSSSNFVRSNREGYSLVDRVRRRFELPTSIAEEIISYFVSRQQSELPLEFNDILKLEKLDDFLNDNLKGRILYLPTYRRIERDVKEVFPEFEEEIKRKMQARRGGRSGETYIELVEFGMEDVATKISDRLQNIRAYALSQVNSLTARYLRDVIRNEASQDSGNIDEIDDYSLEAIFDKIDSAVLSTADKEKLRHVVEKINHKVPLIDNEKYVAHYVKYLVDVGYRISRMEVPVRQFVDICNSYLFGKMFHFDSVGYKLVVLRNSGRDVELEMLSSGEKQIVSLFSHLLLDDQKRNFIIIDEPELSLSVDWQQRFLSDISSLDSCQFIGAVTHSPFIFENDLDQYTVDLLEFSKSSQ